MEQSENHDVLNRDEDWEDNDGALNTISMTHPRLPIEHPSHFVVDESECHPLQPGIWFVIYFPRPHLIYVGSFMITAFLLDLPSTYL